MGMVYYEYYGGDPMKRSLENQLISKFLALVGPETPHFGFVVRYHDTLHKSSRKIPEKIRFQNLASSGRKVS